MSTILSNAAHTAKFANQYNLDEVIDFLVDQNDPKKVYQELKLLYFTLTEYVLNDDTNLVRSNVAHALCMLRYLLEAVEAMTNDDERIIKIVPTSVQVVKWFD